MRQLTNTEWAYLAGIVDGEGCIALRKNYKRNPNRYSYQVVMRVTQRDESLIDWLVITTGVGRKYTTHVMYSGTTHRGEPLLRKKHWRWCVGRKDHARWLIEGMLPYLVVKKAQAELMLKGLIYSGEDGRLSDSELDKICIDLSKLKHNGEVGHRTIGPPQLKTQLSAIELDVRTN